ncbi:hypothetical protein CBD41_06920 [bacterium TMED181]|nr:hypothetical protein [Planctomycetota bacterium]OUW43660.1 MAG: hypothetical protein CBD41_06920 [bacterium TMED181]
MRTFWLILCVLLTFSVSASEPIPPASELQQRRSRIALEEKAELLIVFAGGSEGEEVIRDYEYLTGLRSWDGVLILQKVSGVNESTLFLPAKDPAFELWHGPRDAPSLEARRKTGIDRIVPLEELSEWLLIRKESLQKIYLAEKESSQNSSWRRLIPETVEWASAAECLHHHRQVKSEWEVGQLKRAIDRTHQGLMAGAAMASLAQYEFEIEAAIEARFRAQGSPAPGFPSIVGSGPQSCILHWQENNTSLDRDGVLLMDVGARSGAYTADITRTVPVSGNWKNRQRQVYDVVLRAQRAGIAAVRPGATFRDIDAAARAVIREAGLSEYFPHGTSHHVGMDVHDVGPRRPLVPGMVITVEPGVYIAEENLGIRVEDMVLVTDTGRVVLSAGIPKEAADMERWSQASSASTGSARPAEKEKSEAEIKVDPVRLR